MRHIRFVCFITLLALIPYGLHVWLWSWAGGLDAVGQSLVHAYEWLALLVATIIWMCNGGGDAVASAWRAFCSLCSNELKLWKGEE